MPSATRRIQQYAMRDRRVAWHKAEVCYTGPGWRPTSGAWRGAGRLGAATGPVQHVVRSAGNAVLRVALRDQVPPSLRVPNRHFGAGTEPVLSPHKTRASCMEWGGKNVWR